MDGYVIVYNNGHVGPAYPREQSDDVVAASAGMAVRPAYRVRVTPKPGRFRFESGPQMLGYTGSKWVRHCHPLKVCAP
jgi:hypothetical protein